MIIGSLIICLGSAIIASAKHQPQFVGGRFVLGFGVSILTTAAPSYCVEICPPQWRGRMTGFYNCGWFGGSIPAAGITLATQKMTNDWAWRLPLVLQCAPAFVVICSAMFIPESPRWLMAQGRDKEALAFLTKYHGAGDEQDPIVQLEYTEFKEQIEIDGTDKRVSNVKKYQTHEHIGMMIFSVLGLLRPFLDFFAALAVAHGYFHGCRGSIFWQRPWWVRLKIRYSMCATESIVKQAISTWIFTRLSDMTPTCNLSLTWLTLSPLRLVLAVVSTSLIACPEEKLSLLALLFVPLCWRSMGLSLRSGPTSPPIMRISQSGEALSPLTSSSASVCFLIDCNKFG